MLIGRALAEFASALDDARQVDLADVVDRLLVITAQDKRPAGQPQIQDVDPTGTVRGPAGAPWMEEEKEEEQVIERPPRKVKPKHKGIQVGVDVSFDASNGGGRGVSEGTPEIPQEDESNGHGAG